MGSFLGKVPGFRSGKLWKKIVASILYSYILIIIVAIFAGALAKKEEPPQPAQAAPVAPVIEEKKEPPFDIENVTLTNDNIKQAALNTTPSDKLINAIIDKDIVEIYYNPGDFWDDTDLVKRSANQSVSVFEYLFKNKGINSIYFYTITSMTDIKGNSSDETVISFKLTRANASDINWPKFKDMVLLDYKALIRVLDDTYIHPGVLKNLN